VRLALFGDKLLDDQPLYAAESEGYVKKLLAELAAQFGIRNASLRHKFSERKVTWLQEIKSLLQDVLVSFGCPFTSNELQLSTMLRRYFEQFGLPLYDPDLLEIFQTHVIGLSEYAKRQSAGFTQPYNRFRTYDKYDAHMCRDLTGFKHGPNPWDWYFSWSEPTDQSDEQDMDVPGSWVD